MVRERKRHVARVATLALLAGVIVPVATVALGQSPAHAAAATVPRYTAIPTSIPLGQRSVAAVSPDASWIVTYEFATYTSYVEHDGVSTPIGPSPEGQAMLATGVNNSGTVVGWTQTDGLRSWKWSAGVYTQLCDPYGGCGGFDTGFAGSRVAAVNNDGEAAGISTRVTESGQILTAGVKWTVANTPALIFSGSPQFAQSTASDINQHGDVVGTLSNGSSFFNAPDHAAMYRASTSNFTDLCVGASLCTSGALAQSPALNDRGEALLYAATQTGKCSGGCAGYFKADGKQVNFTKSGYVNTDVRHLDSMGNAFGFVTSSTINGNVVWTNGKPNLLKDLVRSTNGYAGSVDHVFNVADNGIVFAQVSFDSGSAIAMLVPDLIVNNAGDEPDGVTSDGMCQVAGKPGVCTLRAAIQQHNANKLPTGGLAPSISFRIGASTTKVPKIVPKSPLPSITKPVIIDGLSQGAGRVELSGTKAGTAADGLVIDSGGVTIQGMIVNSFARSGIFVGGTGGSVLQKNGIGVDATGMLAKPNKWAGVRVTSPDNAIGTDGHPNLIAGNGPRGTSPTDVTLAGGNGVELIGPDATRNIIDFNAIGLDSTAEHALANAGAGVAIFGAPANHVGLVNGNVIGGNFIGVFVRGNASGASDAPGNTISKNDIGVSETGNAVPNKAGIAVDNASNTIVGGADSDGNVVAGNDGAGILIGSHDETTGNVMVSGNNVGVDAEGDAAGNGGPGIFVGAAAPVTGPDVANVTIGTPAAPNRVGANGEHGITVAGSAVHGIRVEGNDVGRAQPSDAAALANDGHGILVASASDIDIVDNVVGGSTEYGIAVGEYQPDPATPTDVVIDDNRVGITHDGFTTAPNQDGGIHVEDASDVTLGTIEEGNLVGGNGGPGVSLKDTDDVLLINNYIGTDATSTLELPDTGAEVLIDTGVTGLQIGDVTDDEANVIGGPAGGVGIDIRSDDAAIGLNYIGVDESETHRIGHAQDGVRIAASNAAVLISTIRWSTVGVHIVSGTGNDIESYIRDVGTAIVHDPGANGDPPVPALTGAVLQDEHTVITGHVDVTPDASYRLSFYASDAPCTAGEPRWTQASLGTYDITGSPTGHTDFEVAAPEAPSGAAVTAILRRGADNSTSVVSACVSITEP